jgi:hypothetical protein
MVEKSTVSYRSITRFLILIPLLCIAIHCDKRTANVEPEIEPKDKSILLIGSSYFTCNDLKSILENITNCTENNIKIHTAFTNGAYLHDHANSPSTESKINEMNWDDIVLQGVGRLMAYPEYFTDHPVYPALQTLRAKINSNSESTRMIYCLPWAYEDGMTWYQDWTDTYSDMQMEIYNNTLAYSDDIGFTVAPVGVAWKTVLEEKDFPLHYLHVSDWNHPSLRGSYVMACVIYATVFQEDLTGVTYYAGLPEEEAQYFQIVASSTVLDSLERWNITSSGD